MTGFAHKVIELPLHDGNKAYLSLMLKSLNSRFFETTCKIPYALQSMEVEFIRLFKELLFRGKITFTIAMQNPTVFKGPVEPATHIVQSYLTAIDHIQKTFSIPGEVTLENLITLPNVFSEGEVNIEEATQEQMLDVVRALTLELITAQEEEGASLQRDIEARCAILAEQIFSIEQTSSSLFEQRKTMIATKLGELDQQQTDVVELRRTQLYYDLERMDIHEEIVRFKSHLQALKAIIHSQDIEKGRRVDFTLQELMREVNTIAAKCSDASISTHAITIKIELEKIREQAQNIV